ncbi:uncharacterized protein F5891DRAFT_1190287 [Suillus fuscotomentosus]|uniref:Uncharacterized protein n=1 Tax=Suillus fuscotomentosus TaxID=1912939 RepID=A0AAD4E343_9AGAM|nr:uncharacterized protein F5891DRAFT_1190287 [Suillus fuscotomentosus]KAG1898806.1 hypothetical protein F5891DRAFT_1190287 [Suillus fuscotomentosus]
MPIKRLWGILLPMHASAKVTIKGKTLGTPDFLLEIQGLGQDEEFWIMKISCSQTQADVLTRLQCYGNNAPHQTEVFIGDSIEDEKMTINSLATHPWVHPLIIMIKTWIHKPNREFSLNVTAHSNSPYYTCATICPLADSASIPITHLNSVLGDWKYEDADLDVMHNWTPSGPILDWELILESIYKAMLRDGYEWYCQWHNGLKRRADELLEPEIQGGSHTRPRRD